LAIKESTNLDNLPEYTISQISRDIKSTLEKNYGYIRIKGEVSGYKGIHSSGHCYFSLKDKGARIDAVIWKGVARNLKILPEEGLEIIAVGSISAYPNSSRYQIIIEKIQPAGIGSLMVMLEERRKKLAAEGLFLESRKKKCPVVPETIGVITSTSGAAIRDILSRLKDKYPSRVIIWPVIVQGNQCARDVCNAIKGFNSLPSQHDGKFTAPEGHRHDITRPDVIIISRGGGSLEDLWEFNDETLVRTVAESEIPIISAIGHEIDFTLIDYAADIRAPTPTAAAEIAVPSKISLITNINSLHLRILQISKHRMSHVKKVLALINRQLMSPMSICRERQQHLDHISSKVLKELNHNLSENKLIFSSLQKHLRPVLLSNLIIEHKKNLEKSSQRIKYACITFYRKQQYHLQHISDLLRAVSYQSVIQRGFAVIRDEQSNFPISSSHQMFSGQKINIEMIDGPTKAIVCNQDSQPRKPTEKNTISIRNNSPQKGDTNKHLSKSTCNDNKFQQNTLF